MQYSNTALELLEVLEKNPELVKEIGDCPNVATKVLDYGICWSNLLSNDKYTLQRNVFTGHCRILDSSKCRVAWGSEIIMREKYDRLTSKSFLKKGDIIGIARRIIPGSFKIYEHYAVYIGNGEVINFHGEGADFTSENKVRKESFQAFVGNGDCEDYFVLFFDENCIHPHKIMHQNRFRIDDINYDLTINFEKPVSKIYSPEETIKRAKSRLGEKGYNIVTNNCEHFAIWCKTGEHVSYQVNSMVRRLRRSVSL